MFAAAGHAFSSLPPTLIWLVGLAFIVFSVAKKDWVNALPAPVLGLLRTLGLMTYPLYLVHFAVGRAALSLLVTLGVPPLLALVAAVSLVCAIAFIVCIWLEPRIRTGLRSLIDHFYAKLYLGRPVRDQA